MNQKSPCLGCSHQFEDKNSAMCTNCPERIEYANTGTWTKRAPEPAPVKKKRGRPPKKKTETKISPNKKPGPKSKPHIIQLTCTQCGKTRSYPDEMQPKQPICIYCQADNLNKKPSTHSAWAKPKTQSPAIQTQRNPKLDLSKFKKISIAPHIHHEPMIKIAVNDKTGNRSFTFNAACIEEFKINEIAGVDVYVSKNGKGKQIVFAPAKKPTFRVNNSKKSQYGFSNRKLFEQLDVPPGSYPVKNVDGLMLITL